MIFAGPVFFFFFFFFFFFVKECKLQKVKKGMVHQEEVIFSPFRSTGGESL